MEKGGNNYYCCVFDYNIEDVGRVFSIHYDTSPYAILRNNIAFIESDIRELMIRHFEEINLADYEPFIERFPELGLEGEGVDFIKAEKVILRNLRNHLITLQEIAPEGKIAGLWYEALDWLREHWQEDDYFDLPIEGSLSYFVPELISYFDCWTYDKKVFDFSIGQHQAILKKIINQEEWSTNDALVKQVLKTFGDILNELSDF